MARFDRVRACRVVLALAIVTSLAAEQTEDGITAFRHKQLGSKSTACAVVLVLNDVARSEAIHGNLTLAFVSDSPLSFDVAVEDEHGVLRGGPVRVQREVIRIELPLAGSASPPAGAAALDDSGAAPDDASVPATVAVRSRGVVELPVDLESCPESGECRLRHLVHFAGEMAGSVMVEARVSLFRQLEANCVGCRDAGCAGLKAFSQEADVHVTIDE